MSAWLYQVVDIFERSGEISWSVAECFLESETEHNITNAVTEWVGVCRMSK